MPSPHQLYDEAINLKNSGDLEGAIAKLNEIAAEYPDHSDTHSALAVFLQRVGQFDKSIEHAKRVCELTPNDPIAYTQLSVIYVKCGKIQEAEDAKAKSHELRMRAQ